MTLFDFIKNIFFLLVLAYMAPFFIEKIKENYSTILEPRTLIGMITINNKLSDSSLCTKHLNSFFKNPHIKGIVIKINCFDSSPGTSYIIFNELQHLKKEYPKPVITLVENTCLSGAYLIASASDYIIAPEAALIGEIGNYSTTQLDGEMIFQTKSLETINSDIYHSSITLVAVARKLSLSTAINWAQGKIFTGKQAHSLGLINALGSMHTVTTIIKEKALIDSEIEWIEKSAHYEVAPFSIASFASKVQYRSS